MYVLDVWVLRSFVGSFPGRERGFGGGVRGFRILVKLKLICSIPDVLYIRFVNLWLLCNRY